MLNLSRAAARRSKAEGGESAWDGQRPTWHKEKNGQERGWKKLAFAVLFLSLGSSLSACCLPFIWSHLGSKVDAGSVRQIQGEAARRSSSPKSDDAVQPTQKLDAVTRTGACAQCPTCTFEASDDEQFLSFFPRSQSWRCCWTKKGSSRRENRYPPLILP